ncbi:MAG: hypothetical protein K6B67_01830 [Lachnospiraceae bacterium]|nr:hypothetical protein [Lachnospiraceae bacterium]
MGELILCERSLAANPIYIDESGVNIYSLEELNYYIYHNVYLLNNDFISGDLCLWIGHELGLKDLEEQLRKCMEQFAPLHTFVGIILQYTGYLTKSEMMQVVETLTSFENKSPIECQKMRADRLVQKDRIVDAIYEYEYILDDEDAKKISTSFLGDIWHNLGVCYARLFFFDEACACFNEAYRRNSKTQSMKMMLACMRCKRDEEGFNQLVEKYFIADDIVDAVKEEVTALSQQNEIVCFDEQIDSLLARDGDAERSQVAVIISDWKAKYNKLCKI